MLKFIHNATVVGIFTNYYFSCKQLNNSFFISSFSFLSIFYFFIFIIIIIIFYFLKNFSSLLTAFSPLSLLRRSGLVSSFHGSSGADLVSSFHGSSVADLVRWCCCALPWLLQVLGFADRFRGFVVVAVGFFWNIVGLWWCRGGYWFLLIEFMGLWWWLLGFSDWFRGFMVLVVGFYR